MIKNLLAIIFLLWANIAVADDSSLKAKDFIAKIGKETIDTLNNQALTDEAKEQILTDLFVKTVDIKWIGKFALGRYSQRVSPAQLASYDTIYQQFLISSYIPNFRKYTKETILITKALSYDDNEYKVQTEIIRPSKENLKVDYMVKEIENGDFKIFDIIAENISLINTQRADFGSILSQHDFNYLLEELQKKIQDKVVK